MAVWAELQNKAKAEPGPVWKDGDVSGAAAGTGAGAAAPGKDEAIPPPIRYPTAPGSSVLDLDAKYNVLLSSAVHASHRV